MPPASSSSTERKSFLVSVLLLGAVTLYAHAAALTGRDWLETYTPPFHETPYRTDPLHLGAEYYNVAESLYQRGVFENPFGDHTGATAWVAPVLPVLLAAGLDITGGSKTILAVLFLIFQTLVLAAISTYCLRVGRRDRCAPLAALAFAAVVICDFKWCFQVTHDGVFLAALVAGVVVTAASWRRGLRAAPQAVGWGAFGGACGLSSPMAGLAWLVASITSTRGKPLKLVGLAVLSAGLVAAPWTVRNYVTFGKLIPVKSNAGFELYQSLFEEADGVVTVQSMARHPFHRRTDHGQAYRELGEIDFVEQKLQAAQQRIGDRPGDYLGRVIDRFVAATLQPSRAIPAERSGWFYRLQSLLYPLAFFGFLTTLVVRPPGHRKLAPVCQAVYVAYLVPYVLVSFYSRYAVPLLLVRALLTYWFLLLAAGPVLTVAAAASRRKTVPNHGKSGARTAATKRPLSRTARG